jgi:hypothetical protein
MMDTFQMFFMYLLICLFFISFTSRFFSFSHIGLRALTVFIVPGFFHIFLTHFFFISLTFQCHIFFRYVYVCFCFPQTIFAYKLPPQSLHPAVLTGLPSSHCSTTPLCTICHHPSPSPCRFSPSSSSLSPHLHHFIPTRFTTRPAISHSHTILRHSCHAKHRSCWLHPYAPSWLTCFFLGCK